MHEGKRESNIRFPFFVFYSRGVSVDIMREYKIWDCSTEVQSHICFGGVVLLLPEDEVYGHDKACEARKVVPL